MRRTAFLALALVPWLACGGPPGSWREVRWLDPEVFRTVVQPILLQRCASPSCHARVERPFSLYAPGSWRMDPSRTYLRGDPLTDDELEHNFALSCAFSESGSRPEETLLLRKALGEGSGTYHGGGAVLEGTTDDSYRAIRQWIAKGWAP